MKGKKASWRNLNQGLRRLSYKQDTRLIGKEPKERKGKTEGATKELPSTGCR